MKPIAILGGTAGQGLALVLRLARAGERIIIGSRFRERAEAAAAQVLARVPGAQVEGRENANAAGAAERVVIAFPAPGLSAALDDLAGILAGKLLIDVMVPLRFHAGQAELVPVDGAPSIGELLQKRVPSARVVSAFKNVAADLLSDLDRRLAGDVLICGEDPAARAEVAALVPRIPSLRAVDAGHLANVRALEAITALLANLNRQHKARTTIAIVGLDG